MAAPRHWIVVGGANKGGILVRRDAELSSPKHSERLAFASIVEQLSLQGERLQYRLLSGQGPATGWLTTRLSGSSANLVVPTVPDMGGVSQEELREQQPPAMTFYAISDVHVEKKQNFEWLRNLPQCAKSAVIVAGDLGVNLAQLKEALELFKGKFDHVFYCFGNHEMWVTGKSDAHIAEYSDSYEKLQALRRVCGEVGVHTAAKLVEGVWVVPVLGWYHETWDRDPPLQAPSGEKLAREPIAGTKLSTDTHLCKWGQLENGSEDLARLMDAENEAWGIWPLPADLQENLRLPREERRHPVVSFSHFLPRLELMPEKRFLFQPGLAQVVGSDFVHRRIQALDPDLHVFGHSHFPWDMALDGVRYRSWPLGTPDEQARRIAGYPTEHTEQWRPLPVFDSEGRHYAGVESCWYSLMYTRIPREPTSCQMADFVAEAFCPEAPRIPGAILSHGELIEPASEADGERRRKYAEQSYRSVHKQVGQASRS